MSNPAADLTTLLPFAKTVQAGGESIDIAPFRFKQFREVSQYLQIVRSKVSGDGNLDLLQLVADFGGEVGNILRIATGQNAAWVDDLGLDDVLVLAAAILEVNRDFFSQRLGPRLQELMASLSGGER